MILDCKPRSSMQPDDNKYFPRSVLRVYFNVNYTIALRSRCVGRRCF